MLSFLILNLFNEGYLLDQIFLPKIIHFLKNANLEGFSLVMLNASAIRASK